MYKAKIVLTVLLLGMFLVACTNENDVKENEFWDSEIKSTEEGLDGAIEIVESFETLNQLKEGYDKMYKGYKDSPQSKQINAAIASFKDDFSTLKNNYEKAKLQKKGKIKVEKKREYNEELQRLWKKVNEYPKEIEKLVNIYEVDTKNRYNMLNYMLNNR
jgi:hypothetical protein